MPKIKNIFAVILSLLFATCILFFAHGITQNNSADTLSQINSYQSEYFRIIKRHNVLLQVSENNSADKDLQDLSNLYKKVESKIDPNCEFLKQYHNIEQQYARRTVGTKLYKEGKSLRVIRDVLHHSDVSTTERYLGITPQELDEAYLSLDD